MHPTKAIFSKRSQLKISTFEIAVNAQNK